MKNFIQKSVLLAVMVFGVMVSYAQIERSSEAVKYADESHQVFQVVEQAARFPGGFDKMNKFLSDNIKYPEKARKDNVQGRVMLSFIIETDGSISDVKVLRGIGKECDAEAVRVIKSMPKWEPAKNKGKKVRQEFVLPVTFSLQDK